VSGKPSRIRIAVCERCGEPFETLDPERTRCPTCPTHQAPHADPGWKDDEDPGFSNAVRIMEDQ